MDLLRTIRTGGDLSVACWNSGSTSPAPATLFLILREGAALYRMSPSKGPIFAERLQKDTVTKFARSIRV
jgi:hypothetical protein